MSNSNGKGYVLVTVNMEDASEDMHPATKADLALMRKDISKMVTTGTPAQTIKALQSRLVNAVPGAAPVLHKSPAPADDDYGDY
jgi:hypothetical protein